MRLSVRNLNNRLSYRFYRSKEELTIEGVSQTNDSSTHTQYGRQFIQKPKMNQFH